MDVPKGSSEVTMGEVQVKCSVYNQAYKFDNLL